MYLSKETKKVLKKDALRISKAVVQKKAKSSFSVKNKKQKKTEKNSTGTAQVFSSEFCKICKNSYFVEHLRTAAQVFYEKSCS